MKTLKAKKIRVITVTCSKCGTEMFSRARHDFHGCDCGTLVDGGFDYLRYLYPPGAEKPKVRTRYITATRKELFDDWNTRINRFGFIDKKGA